VGIINLAGKYALVVSKYKMPMLSQLKFLTAEFFSAEKKRAISVRHVISYTKINRLYTIQFRYYNLCLRILYPNILCMKLCFLFTFITLKK
jgi:hypothetical protein